MSKTYLLFVSPIINSDWIGASLVCATKFQKAFMCKPQVSDTPKLLDDSAGFHPKGIKFHRGIAVYTISLQTCWALRYWSFHENFEDCYFNLLEYVNLPITSASLPAKNSSFAKKCFHVFECLFIRSKKDVKLTATRTSNLLRLYSRSLFFRE